MRKIICSVLSIIALVLLASCGRETTITDTINNHLTDFDATSASGYSIITTINQDNTLIYSENITATIDSKENNASIVKTVKEIAYFNLDSQYVETEEKNDYDADIQTLSEFIDFSLSQFAIDSKYVDKVSTLDDDYYSYDFVSDFALTIDNEVITFNEYVIEYKEDKIHSIQLEYTNGTFITNININIEY